MKGQIPSGRFKAIAALVLLVAMLFFVFFDRSKHVPALAAVNSFADDPYDAVGSFAVQLTAFTALLSVLRVFRPYPEGGLPPGQAVLVLRAWAVALLSIAVTVAADAVAMSRHLPQWAGSSAGVALSALVGGLAVLTALVGWMVFSAARSAALSSGSRSWGRAAATCAAGVILLALYPEHWRQSVPGGILAALVGMVVLFLAVWALAVCILPRCDLVFEDSVDDLAAVYAWVRARSGRAAGVQRALEGFTRLRRVQTVVGRLDPRRHPWVPAVLVALAMGLALALAEAVGEGGLHPLSGFAMVAVVFVLIEGLGVLLGYALLGGYLGIFRSN